MGMVINNNIPALQAFNAVNATSNALQKSIQKLSTGLRINSAADDAAGLAISEKMRAQIRGLDQAVRNSQDGISMIQTAEGALSETHSILQRMRELSVQAANDTLTQQDRAYIQEEIDQLREEVTRIGNTTQFNKKKLLDGSAAVLWSSDRLTTKAMVRGGLREIDQFGQKNSLEGNYNITISANPGQGQVQKPDIFKIKHENVVMNLGIVQDEAVGGLRIDNLPAGDYTVKYATLTGGVVQVGQYLTAGNFSVAANGTLGANASILFEVVSVNTASGSMVLKATANILSANGTTKTYVLSEITVGTSTKTITADQLGVALDLSVSGLSSAQVGAKMVYNATVAGNGITVSGTQTKGWPDGWGTDANGNPGAVTMTSLKYGINNTVKGEVQFRNFYVNSATGRVYEGAVVLDITDATKFSAGTVAAFTAAYVGQIATGDVKLRDLDKFWDAQGRFLLDDPQTLTITMGDGTRTDVTLYANDTLNVVAKKLNDAIGGGLDQFKYTTEGNQFVTFVEEGKEKSGTSESVAGTFVIRSVVAGKNGEINFAGDEDLIKALSLNTIQKSEENVFNVSIYDAHSGNTIASGVKITGNNLVGVLDPNIDVTFDAMANIKVQWNDTTKSFSLVSDTNLYNTVLHLADNTTVFQIGANEGEDMGIHVGDMRAEALGLNGVLVTDRQSAARSITVIDNAIDRVSMQRSKLGAYQNRLEHTINNLTVAGENLTAAESRIRDLDMAKEMMNYTKLSIMLQAGNSMLAQANQLPQNVLSLLR